MSPLCFFHPLYTSLQKVMSRPASIWRKIEVRKVIKYVIDDVWGMRYVVTDLVRGTYSRKKSFTWFPTFAWAGWVDCSLPGHEEKEQGRGRRQGFLPPTSEKGVPMIMEPLVYLSVTATTLTRHLAYLRQAMAMLHVVYASISILLDMGGAGLIRDLGGIIST